MPAAVLSRREIKPAGGRLSLGQPRKWQLSTRQLPGDPGMGAEGVYCGGFHELIYDLGLVNARALGCNLPLSYREEACSTSRAWLPAVPS